MDKIRSRTSKSPGKTNTPSTTSSRANSKPRQETLAVGGTTKSFYNIVSSSVGIKLRDGSRPSEFLSGSSVATATEVTTTSAVTNGSSEKRPNRHRIQVYDASSTKCGKIGKTSPYLCEVVKWPKQHPPSSYKEIYVSDREYKLLQTAFNLQPLPPRNSGVTKFQKTLFGYVSLPSSPVGEDDQKKTILKSSRSTTSSKKSRGSSRERKQRQQSVNDLNKRPEGVESRGGERRRSTILKFEDNEQDTQSHNDCQTETDDNANNSDYNDLEEQSKELLKMVHTSASPIVLTLSPPTEAGEVDLESLSHHHHHHQHHHHEEETQTCENFKKLKYFSTLHPPSSSSEEGETNKSKNIENQPAVDLLKSNIFAASETCMILMNTLFGDALNDPNVSTILAKSTPFQNFINSTNELQALETAGIIFETASKAVTNYLNLVQDPPSIEPQSITTVTRKPHEEDEVEDDVEIIENTKLLREVSEVAEKCSVRSNVTLNEDDGCNDDTTFHMTLTSSTGSGILVQSIVWQDYEFKLNFIGSSRKVNSLMSSSRSNSRFVTPTPLQLLEMTERSSSYTVGRLTASKYHLLLAYDKLTATIRQCLAGKHGYYSKSLKRAELKLRGLNMFSGIVLQICSGLTDMFKKLFIALDIIMQLEDLLKCPRLPSFGHRESQNRLMTASSTLLSSGANPTTATTNKDEPPPEMTMMMRHMALFLNDIDNVMEIGRNSLAGIQLKNPTVKVKKSLRQIIQILYEASLQLDNKHHVDLGTLVMSMVCNVNIILSTADFSQAVSSLDINVRKRMMTSLNQLDHSLLDVYELCKRMSILASHLATKSLVKLKKTKEVGQKLVGDKEVKGATNNNNNIPWYKRRIFHRKAERTYSLINVPSPSIEDPHQHVMRQQQHSRSDKLNKILLRKAESEGQISVNPVPEFQDTMDEHVKDAVEYETKLLENDIIV